MIPISRDQLDHSPHLRGNVVGIHHAHHVIATHVGLLLLLLLLLLLGVAPRTRWLAVGLLLDRQLLSLELVQILDLLR